MRQQLFHHQPLLGRVPAFHQLGYRGTGRGLVDQFYGFGNARQLVVRQQFRWQPVFDGVTVQVLQRLLAQPAHPGLLYAFGERIHRGERGFVTRRHGRRVHLVFGVVKLVTGAARADFAKATYPGAFGQLVTLGGIEVEKPHYQKTAVVPQGDLQATAPAHHQVGFHNLPFHHRNIANAQAAHGDYPGAVLIAVRKVEQQVLYGMDAEFCQCSRQGVSYALELGNGDVFQ